MCVTTLLLCLWFKFKDLKKPIKAVVCLEKNYMKLNKDKCQGLISGKKIGHVWTKIGKRLLR